MLENKVESLDLHKFIGTVTLSDGVTVLNIPKLSVGKLVKIVKWIGIDGVKLYSQFENIISDESMDEFEKFAVILSEMSEEQLIQIFAIALDLPADQVLALDLDEMLEIVIVYAEKLNMGKTYSLVQKLYKTTFKKDLPNLKDLFKKNQVLNQIPAANSILKN